MGVSWLRASGIALELLNLGGGLPAHYREAVPPLAAYSEASRRAYHEFGAARPEIMVEPGRYLVGDAGLLRTEILLISRNQPMSLDVGYTLMQASTTVWTKRLMNASIITSAHLM